MHESETVHQRGGHQALFVSISAVLLATGWAANHFAALIPDIGDRQHLSAVALDAVFAIYAAGLLPGLLIGGRVSDTVGRSPVVWLGSLITLIGTMVMALSLHIATLFVGRLIVGAGVGLAISSCTAWAADLKGPRGAALAGAVLTAGFAIGPFVAGLLVRSAAVGVRLSFVVAAVLVGAATVAAFITTRRKAAAVATAPMSAPRQSMAVRSSSAGALAWAIPLAPWVFASATLAFITIPTRLHVSFTSSMIAGVAALITNGASALVQVLARGRQWGPQTGSFGALLAGSGYAIVALTPQVMTPELGLVLLAGLGSASGLLLREGLIDLEAAAPRRVRGALTGVFYAVTYTGFGLPLLLAMLNPTQGSTVLAVMAVLASVTGIVRAVRLRRHDHRQKPEPLHPKPSVVWGMSARRSMRIAAGSDSDDLPVHPLLCKICENPQSQ